MEVERRRIVVEALPGAVVGLMVGESQDSLLCYLPLVSADQGKTLRLRHDGPLVYKNDQVCFLDMAAILQLRRSAADPNSSEERKQQAAKKLRSFERALLRLEKQKIKPRSRVYRVLSASVE